eukprot:g1013.t1
MRAIQESVARSRQAALERTLRRNAEEQAAQEALQQQEELRLEKESRRCLQARWDLIQAVNVAHEADALAYLEEMRGHVDMLVVSDEYGSTLLHEACARGMKRLATAVLQATAEAEEQKILFQRDYRGQTDHRCDTARGRQSRAPMACRDSDSDEWDEDSTDLEGADEELKLGTKAGARGGLALGMSSGSERSNAPTASGSSSGPRIDEQDPPPVRILLIAFMCMFQGYGCMVGGPAHALKHKLGISHEQAAEFQDATASQIAFLAFMEPTGIVYMAYVVMFLALWVPVVFVWGAGVTELWVVYLQYILGGVAIGLFEGTFLSVISSLGRNTKTFAIMGAPLGFFVNNTILALLTQVGVPDIFYYFYDAMCLPFAMYIFHVYRPREAKGAGKGKGCSVFMSSISHAMDWLPHMILWFVAKFIGNFDGFPLLYNTFNTEKVPIFGGPESTTHLVPFTLYTALMWFPAMAAGDTVSRRVPQFLDITVNWKCYVYLLIAITMCVVGEAMDFLLLALVTVLAVFISNFGNGFIYGLSAKFIDWKIAEEHRYTVYNLFGLVEFLTLSSPGAPWRRRICATGMSKSCTASISSSPWLAA